MYCCDTIYFLNERKLSVSVNSKADEISRNEEYLVKFYEYLMRFSFLFDYICLL